LTNEGVCHTIYYRRVVLGTICGSTQPETIILLTIGVVTLLFLNQISIGYFISRQLACASRLESISENATIRIHQVWKADVPTRAWAILLRLLERSSKQEVEEEIHW
jgi:hypothetical protein